MIDWNYAIAMSIVVAGPIGLVVSIGEAFAFSRRIRRLEACRAKPDDVARMWDAVEWVEAVAVQADGGHFIMSRTEDGSARIASSVFYTEAQQAAHAALEAAIDAEPPTQLYRRKGRRFIRVGNIDQHHSGANAA